MPGLSQIAFVQAIRHAGAARAAVLIGVAPMLSFILAAIFLGEGINAGLVAGAALIVTAGASLSFERSKPPGYRTLGAVLAVLCAGLFAVRDTLVRWASGDATLDATRAHRRLARGGCDRRRRPGRGSRVRGARRSSCASRCGHSPLPAPVWAWRTSA